MIPVDPPGEELTSAGPADVAAIRDLVEEAERLQGDAAGFAGLLTEDVVLVNAVGRRIFGRDAVRAALTDAMRTPLAAVRTRNEVADIRSLRDDIAIVSGVKHVSSGRDRSTATFTFVVVREADSWRIALAHSTLVPD